MQLLIKIENGEIVDHPILFENFKMVYPDANYDNLPTGYIKFTRVERPVLSRFQKFQSETSYVIENGVARDDWVVLDMTEEEKSVIINDLKSQKPFNSWIWSDESLSYSPPIPYPDDGLMYKWNEDTTSWVEV